MAYVTKYQITFSDLHSVNPTDWKVEFQLDGYSGSITDLQPGANPLSIKFGEDSDRTDDKLATLIGTECDITIVVTDANFDKTEFWVTEETAIKVLISRGGDVYFSGFVKPDFCSYPYRQPPYEFTISAADGIGFLKGILPDLEVEARGDNIIGIIDLLTTRGLFKAQNDEVADLRVISSLHRVGKTILENEATRIELIYDDSDTHTFLNIYDILNYIATSYGCRIITAEGKYWMQRVADLPKNANPTIYKFSDPDTAPIQITDYEIIKDLDGPDGLSTADVIYANNDSFVTIQAALKTIKANIDYKFTGSLLNFDWFYFTGGAFDNWTSFDSNCIVHQITDSADASKKALYIEGYGGGTTYLWQKRAILYGYATINIKATVKFWGYDTAKLNFRVNNPDGSTFLYYIQGTNSWGGNTGSTSDGDYTIKIPTTTTEKEINLDLPFWDVPTFGSGSGIPQPNILEVRIIDPGDANGDTDRPTGITAAGVEFGPIILTMKYNDRIGDVITVNNPKNYSTVESLDNFKLIDSDPGIFNLANAINYPGETDALDWISADQNYASNAFQVTQFRSFMGLSDYPYENMTGTYYSNSISANHVIKRLADNKLFIIMSDEYDVKNCLHKMKLFEVKDIEITTPTLVVKQEYKKGEAFNAQ